MTALTQGMQMRKEPNTFGKYISRTSHQQKITLLLKFTSVNIKKAVFVTVLLTLHTTELIQCSVVNLEGLILNVFNHLMHNVPKRSDTL